MHTMLMVSTQYVHIHKASEVSSLEICAQFSIALYLCELHFTVFGPGIKSRRSGASTIV